MTLILRWYPCGGIHVSSRLHSVDICFLSRCSELSEEGHFVLVFRNSGKFQIS